MPVGSNESEPQRSHLLPQPRLSRLRPDTAVASRPLIYVVRYCGEEDASTSAAIRQAIGVLDTYLDAIGVPAAGELVVIYRNRLQGAVKLEIGYPVDQAIADKASGEIMSGTTPSGAMVSTVTGRGFAAVLAAERRLTGGVSMSARNHPFTWQSFKTPEFRPWRGHPPARLLAPMGRAGTSPKSGSR